MTAQAHAQAATRNIVSACSGVSLPPSDVTRIITPVVNGIVTPVENSVNSILGLATGVVGVPDLNIDTATLLADAAAGDPVTLQVLNANGTVVGPDDRCDLQADSVGLNTEGGVSIGGNRITGLGTNGREAVAGEADSIALGNSASTASTSANAMALGTGATVGANAAGGIALGSGTRTTAANSVALGTNSVAGRGALAGYAALGITAPQNSLGEVSVGAAGAERQITNVAAGSAPTDAVNVAQLTGVAAQVGVINDTAVLYDGPTKDRVTLAGAAGTTITNLAPGALGAGSTDAVNGSQLFATNTEVTNNAGAITNLTTNIQNGSIGPVQYSNAGSPTVPNGGAPTNDLTLVGGAAGPVGLHNVANGTIAAGSTDAVNGGQIYGLALTATNAVSYDTNVGGARTNTITLQGGNTAAPVTITNVTNGTVAAGSSDAVNGGQLYTTNQAVTIAQTTADSALAMGENSVQYDDPGHTSVTLGASGGGQSGAPVEVHNVAAGTSGTDAVNVAQLSSGLNGAVNQANGYTDQRVMAINYDLQKLRRASYAGTAGALAAAGLPQAYTAGQGMVAMGGGSYGGQSAFAVGFSKAMNDGHTVVKLSGSYNTQGRAGASGGIGYQF